MNNHNDAAEHIIGRRVVERTKKNYRCKINTIKIFLANLLDEYGEPVEGLIDDDGDLILPLDASIIESMFGWLSTNTDLPKKARRAQDDEGNDIDEDENYNKDKNAKWQYFNRRVSSWESNDWT